MHHLDLAVRSAVAATLQTATTTDDGGPTPEQQQLIDIVATHLLGLGDHDAASAGEIDPAAAAAALDDDAVRRLVGEGLVTMELMRRPGSAVLADRVDGYLTALGFEGPEQLLVRDAVAEASEQVAADWARTRTPSVSTPGPDVDEHHLVGQVAAMAECPPGSLGRSFHEFNARHGFTYPAAQLSLIGHDFAHVLTGYEPVPEGELALQALLVAAPGGAHHTSGLLASLLLYEVGLLPFPDIEPKVGVLERDGSAELFVDAVGRGVEVETDIQALDHFALAERDLIALRAELGVPAPVPGPFSWA